MTIQKIATTFSIHERAVRQWKLRTRLGDTVFNPDDRRLQKAISVRHPFVRQVVAVLKAKRLITEDHFCGGAVVIHSKPNCMQQQWHTDYDIDALKNIKQKPKGVLVALQNGTRFVTPSRTYTMKCGDILVFDGDEIHAGSGYKKANTRLHLYMDVPYVDRTENETYLIHS